MMKTNKHLILGFLSLIFLAVACTDDVHRTVYHYSPDEYEILSQHLSLPEQLHEYGQDQSSFILNGHQNNSSIFGTGNEPANHLATLGRVLFYDTKLSINNTVSCGTCHQQHLAFADDVKLSVGFDGEVGLRNSLPLGNTVGFETAYGGGGSFVANGQALFGWDESNTDVQSQSLAAITSTVEMGMHDMKQVQEKLKNDPAYEILFDKAFGNTIMHKTQILDALDKFVNSIVSNQSRFDEAALDGNDDFFVDVFSNFEDFTDGENRGKQIYLQNCASCHSADHTFTAVARANNGLDYIYEDKGVGSHTGLESDNGVFKVPFLRNIELTAPYMHDGRFETLDEIIDFYSDGIKNHENLSPQLKGLNNQPRKFNFSNSEKQDLKAYLRTLTDEKLVADAKWSDPFK